MDNEKEIVTQVLPQIARNLQELLPKNWEWAIMAIPKTLDESRLVLLGSNNLVEELIKPEIPNDKVSVSQATGIRKRTGDSR